MSFTVTIPGGTAELLSPEELTPRRQRAVQVIALMAGPLLKKMQNAGTLQLPDGTTKVNPDAAVTGLEGMPDVYLTEKEAEMFFKIQDASIYANLKSWTLTNPDGSEMARPETVDAVQDIPGPVYDALSAAINVPAVPADPAAEPVATPASFEPSDATLENPASPFGNSGDSATSSPETPALI